MPWKIFDRKNGAISEGYGDLCIARNHCAARNAKLLPDERRIWQDNRFILLPYGSRDT